MANHVWGNFKRCFHEEFLVLSLPKTVTLQSHRIGRLYRILQAVMLFMIIIYCVQAEVGLVRHEVQPWGVQLWVDNPNAGMENALRDSYCMHPAAYQQSVGEHSSFAPSSCIILEGVDGHFNDNIRPYVHTFVQDTTVLEGFGDECGLQIAPWCTQNSSHGKFKERDNHCSCTFVEEFLVLAPEERRVVLQHGFEVDLSGGKGEEVQRGGIVISESEGAANIHETETVFQQADGQLCKVGGKSHWMPAEARNGIEMTLQDLLACAGVSLDEPPRFRTTGLTLNLHLDYQESLAGKITCRIAVIASLSLTRAPHSSDFVKLPGGISGRRTRLAHSIALVTSVSGQVHSWAWPSAVKGFCDVAVLMQVPRMIMGFVALHCLGVVSDIYRSAKRTKLSVFALFHSAAAKFMLAEVAFRGLIGGIWHGSAQSLCGLTHHMLLRHMRDVFHEHITDGTLQENELRRMSEVIFVGMDKRRAGTIACSEFIHAVTDGDDINLREMAKIFDDDDTPPTNRFHARAASFLGRCLDHTYEQRAVATEAVNVDNLEFYQDQDSDDPSGDKERSMVAQDSMELNLRLTAVEELAGSDLKFRLAALEELAGRTEGRVTALETKHTPAASTDVDALQDVRTELQTVRHLHTELHTVRHDLEARLQALEQTVQQVLNQNQQKGTSHEESTDSHQQGKESSKELTRSHQQGEGSLVEGVATKAESIDKKKHLPRRAAERVSSALPSARSVSSISSRQAPPPRGPEKVSGALPSARSVSSITSRQTSLVPCIDEIPSLDQVAEEIPAALSDCSPRKPQRKTVSKPVAPALSSASPRLVQQWQAELR